jgi:hypothetical protein
VIDFGIRFFNLSPAMAQPIAPPVPQVIVLTRDSCVDSRIA